MVDVESERVRLMRLAYRMLGSWNDAEDIVQQSFERWYRLDPVERERIENPAAWFTTAASRLCLNLLGSAPMRRERYVGPWLPEPIPAYATSGVEPLDRVTRDDSVSMALLVALESLTPAERVTYVLHEAFGVPYAEIAEIVGRTPAAVRQAAVSARRHLDDGRYRPSDPGEHSRLVDAFQEACEHGDLAGLIAVLDPQVTSISDGNGRIGIARQPVVGAVKVAPFLLGILRRPMRGVVIERTVVNDAPGFALVRTKRKGRRDVLGVISFHIASGKIRGIYFAMSPDKLAAWQPKQLSERRT
ncbi:sigma-70 family RNA polymerase sigma factor [Microbacterium caowuchunii]|uniref:RNA polymerase sigma factor SigJ n=1 Tax=Microbacterium caowuchunii TaxID=2614638 RepID=UPI00124898A9|nr:RNA polymerase sigma factor SigJ [Microbacterium caowuchunii]QEW00348.1 sigma-70 family RNA polymerase sigma factor [Microbacterium caowuchunii]